MSVVRASIGPKKIHALRLQLCLTFAGLGLGLGGSAQAAQTPPTQARVLPDAAAPQQATGVQAVAAEGAALGQVVRGVSMQAHVGGGYMVADRKIAANKTFPQLTGHREMLGAGPSLDVALGVDILSFLSLQLAAGMTYAGARRVEYAHSLEAGYLAIGPRFTVPVHDRVGLNLAPAFAYFVQHDGIGAAVSGSGVIFNVGAEYYAHVRHFSAGADLSIQAPLAPTRLFIGIMPHVRYTF